MEERKGKVKLAISPCPNDTFIFGAWINGLLPDGSLEPPSSVGYMDIQELNQVAELRDYDVIKVSAAVAPRLLSAYQILPCGGALGHAVGPLLVCRKEFLTSGKPFSSVILPGKDTTASALFRFAFPEHADIRHLVFDQIESAVLGGEADAGVLIHEGRFTYAARGLGLLMDLGENWTRQTGLPIPLGLILVRRDLHPAIKDALSRTIRASIGFAWANQEELMPYIRTHAAEMDTQVIRDHICLYVNDFSQNPGPAGMEACSKLFALTHPGYRFGQNDFA